MIDNATVGAVALLDAGNVPSGATGSGGVQHIDAGYSAGLADASAFEASLQAARDAAAGSARVEATMSRLLEPLDYINKEAQSLIRYANDAVASGTELTPSEIVMLTAKSQEFMFHSQLTANVANRTADGLQQLFRQQS